MAPLAGPCAFRDPFASSRHARLAGRVVLLPGALHRRLPPHGVSIPARNLRLPGINRRRSNAALKLSYITSAN
jgi:hypothetical protein